MSEQQRRDLTLVDVIPQALHLLRVLPVLLQPIPLKPRGITQDHRVSHPRLHDVAPLAPSRMLSIPSSETHNLALGWPSIAAIIELLPLLIAPLERLPPKRDVVVHDHHGPSFDVLVPIR